MINIHQYPRKNGVNKAKDTLVKMTTMMMIVTLRYKKLEPVTKIPLLKIRDEN